MKYYLKIVVAILIMSCFINAQEGYAMAKHVHFVDQKYEGGVLKGQPVGQTGTAWWFRVHGFSIRIKYPAAHRVKLPLKQWFTLQVTDLSVSNGEFELLEWVLEDPSGNPVKMLFSDINGGNTSEENVYRERKIKALGFPIPFYTDIPKDVDELVLKFKIKLEAKDGESHIVEESIPLHRAYFKPSIWESYK